jgi:hypothetical protein
MDQARAWAARLYPVPPQPAIWGLYGSFDLDRRRLFPPYLAQLTGFLRVTEGTPEHLRLLRVGAVSHVIALHRRGFEDLEPAGTFESLYHEPVQLFRVPDPLPRAYAVGGTRVADGLAALEQVLVDPLLEPRREVILPSGIPRAIPSGFESEVHIVDLRPDRVRLRVRASHDAWIVLVDTFDPGWRATVDGREEPLLRANHAFRAVHVPAGDHVVEQVYRPRALLLGLSISAIGLVFSAAAWAVGRDAAAAIQQELTGRGTDL